MEALKETTGGDFHPHIYLLDGTSLVAFKRHDTGEIKYFKNPIKGFDKRGRKFEVVKPNPFKAKAKTNTIAVAGSKGNTYYVDPDAQTCTCSGFQFRGTCKHLKEVLQ